MPKIRVNNPLYRFGPDNAPESGKNHRQNNRTGCQNNSSKTPVIKIQAVGAPRWSVSSPWAIAPGPLIKGLPEEITEISWQSLPSIAGSKKALLVSPHPVLYEIIAHGNNQIKIRPPAMRNASNGNTKYLEISGHPSKAKTKNTPVAIRLER